MTRNFSVGFVLSKNCRVCKKVIFRDERDRTWYDDKDLTKVHRDFDKQVITFTDIDRKLTEISAQIDSLKDVVVNNTHRK